MIYISCLDHNSLVRERKDNTSFYFQVPVPEVNRKKKRATLQHFPAKKSSFSPPPLSLSLSIYLSIYLFIYLSIYPSFRHFIFSLSLYVVIFLSIVISFICLFHLCMGRLIMTNPLLNSKLL